jgi:hypothetical protein
MLSVEQAHRRMNLVLGLMIAALLIFLGGIVVIANRDVLGISPPVRPAPKG